MNYYYNLPDEIIQKIQKINFSKDLKNEPHNIWWKLSAVKCQDHKYKYIDTELIYRDYFEMPRLFNLVFDVKNNYEIDERKVREIFTIQQLQELLKKNKYAGKIPKQYKTIIKTFLAM